MPFSPLSIVGMSLGNILAGELSAQSAKSTYNKSIRDLKKSGAYKDASSAIDMLLNMAMTDTSGDYYKSVMEAQSGLIRGQMAEAESIAKSGGISSGLLSMQRRNAMSAVASSTGEQLRQYRMQDLSRQQSAAGAAGQLAEGQASMLQGLLGGRAASMAGARQEGIMGAANTAGSMFLSNKQKTLGDFMPQILKILENGTGVANNNATSNSSMKLYGTGVANNNATSNSSMKLFGDNFNLGKALMQVGKSTIPTGSNTGFGNEPPDLAPLVELTISPAKSPLSVQRENSSAQMSDIGVIPDFLGTSIGNVAGNTGTPKKKLGNIFTNAYEDIANFLKNLFGG